jgi:hypothetical protein
MFAPFTLKAIYNDISFIKAIWKYMYSSLEFNPLLHEHFVKNAFFIEKSPVTSSNCYKTIKTALILIKLGTNVDHCLCNNMLSLNFPVTMATRGHLKIVKKITILR